MFAQDTYNPTYSGPILASGDNLRRARNSAMQQAQFQGNQRAFRPQGLGIGAGSKMSAFRSGLLADAEKFKGMTAAQQAYQDNMLANAEANTNYQRNRAQEEAGIRSLRTNRLQTDQKGELDYRDLDIGTQLQIRQRRVENQARDAARGASMGGLLMGLFT